MMEEVIDLCSSDEEAVLQPKKKQKTASHSSSSANLSEDNTWQPFYLTTVMGIDKQSNERCLSFSDLLFHDESSVIEEVCLMNFMIDLPWVVSQCPCLLACPLLVLHGSSVEAVRNEGWVMSKVDMGPERFGTHHSKLALVFYATGVRIVVTTANFIPEDFSYRTQASYVQDFPLKPSYRHSKSQFEADLVEYLGRVSVSERATQRLQHIAQRLRGHDFSLAEVSLVPSVPGRHTAQKEKWGVGKLCRALSAAGLQGEQWEGYRLCMQCSSLGSMGKDGALLNDYARRILSGSNRKTREKEEFELVWPTVQCVRESLQGYEAGGSLPCSFKTLHLPSTGSLLPGFQNRLYRWNGTVSGRARATPHMKCYFRYNRHAGGRLTLAWFLLTSANLSQAAFGVFQTNNTQLYIKSYEMGVLYLPNKVKSVGRRFTCTPSHPILGQVRADQGDAGSSAVLLTEFTVGGHSYCLENRREIGFPIPFELPPEPYGAGDEPWVWDREFRERDALGRTKTL